MSLLEYNITKKKKVKKIPKLDNSNNNSTEYKVEAIWESAIYTNKLESDYLP